jgi:hypothetical protein
VEEIAKILNDDFRLDKSDKGILELSKIPDPAKKPLNVQYRHIYPDSNSLDDYLKVMCEDLNSFLRLPQNPSLEKIVACAAEFYRYAANARPFKQINNSLFMNMFNTMLQFYGYRGISHEIHDHVAHRLQKADNFNKWMLQKVMDAQKKYKNLKLSKKYN